MRPALSAPPPPTLDVRLRASASTELDALFAVVVEVWPDASVVARQLGDARDPSVRRTLARQRCSAPIDVLFGVTRVGSLVWGPRPTLLVSAAQAKLSPTGWRALFSAFVEALRPERAALGGAGWTTCAGWLTYVRALPTGECPAAVIDLAGGSLIDAGFDGPLPGAPSESVRQVDAWLGAKPANPPPLRGVLAGSAPPTVAVPSYLRENPSPASHTAIRPSVHEPKQPGHQEPSEPSETADLPMPAELAELIAAADPRAAMQRSAPSPVRPRDLSADYVEQGGTIEASIQDVAKGTQLPFVSSPAPRPVMTTDEYALLQALRELRGDHDPLVVSRYDGRDPRAVHEVMSEYFEQNRGQQSLCRERYAHWLAALRRRR